MSATPAPGTKNHLVGSIICTVGNLVLLPFSFGLSGLGAITGVVAIVFGFLVNSRLSSGDTIDAAAKSRLARIFYLITLVVLIISIVITLIVVVLFGIILATGSAQ